MKSIQPFEYIARSVWMYWYNNPINYRHMNELNHDTRLTIIEIENGLRDNYVEW